MTNQIPKWKNIAAELGVDPSYCIQVLKGKRRHAKIEAKISELAKTGLLPPRRYPRFVARLGRYPIRLTRPLMPH